MITAKEAQRITKESEPKIIKAKLEKISEKIRHAAESNLNEVDVICESHEGELSRELLSLGFGVKYVKLHPMSSNLPRLVITW